MIHSSDHALSEVFLMMLIRMFSFQMMFEKLIKKNSARYHKSKRIMLFSGIFFLYFFNGVCWMSLPPVQMTTEPEKTVAAIDA